jgi:hypothetical protein
MILCSRWASEMPFTEAHADLVRRLASQEDGLAVVVTNRIDLSPQVSVVNVGILDHPVSGSPVVGFVIKEGPRKLANLRVRPQTTILFRSGWKWVAVEGKAVLAGPNDRLEALAPDQVPALLRNVYAASVGGAPDP